MSDKPPDEREMALQEFIMIGFSITKFAYMIYGVSMSKGKGLGYSIDPFNPRSRTLIKPT